MNDHIKHDEMEHPLEGIFGTILGFVVVTVIMIVLSIGVFPGWQWWMYLPPFFTAIGIAATTFEYFTKFTIKCPNCESRINRKADYCDKCGNKLLKTCPDCGNDIVGTGKYCQKCGRLVYDNLELPKKTNVGLKLNLKNNSNQISSNTQEDKPNLKFCPACGTKTPSYAKHCSACGFNL